MNQAVDTSDSLNIDIKKVIRRKNLTDKIVAIAGLLTLFFILLILLLMISDLAQQGWSRITWDFVSTFPSRDPNKAGVISALVGSFAIMLTTAFFAIPIGIGAAIYLEEYAPKGILTTLIEINISNLAGVPSITFGLMALGIFVYKLNLGQSILTAGLTLSFLILSIIIVATRESLKTVPVLIREASLALGATKWQTIWYQILPASTGGILTGVIIALSRAVGETAPLITIGALTFIAFLPTSPVQSEFPYLSFQWLKDPFTAIPIQMFNWTSRPQEEFHWNAAALGLLLLIFTLLMNGMALYLRYYFRKKIKW